MSARIRVTMTCDDCGEIQNWTPFAVPVDRDSQRRVTVPKSMGTHRCDPRIGSPCEWGWEHCKSCGGGGWVGSRHDHKHPSCGHRCILCFPPPGYDRTYALDAAS